MVVRAATPEAVKAALARPEVASVLVPDRGSAHARPDGAHLRLGRRRRIRSSPATSTGASGASPSSRSSSPSARSCRGPSRRRGAVATQAYANPRYGPDGLALLRQGLSAEEVVRRLTEADDGRDERQLGVVDAAGRGATFTGIRLPRLGGRAHRRRLRRAGEHPRLGRDGRRAGRDVRGVDGSLAERLLEALAAAQAAGGDRRGQQSAVAPRRRAGRRLRGSLGRRARPARGRPRARRSRSCGGSTACTSSSSAGRRARVADGRRGAPCRARRAPRQARLRAAGGLGGRREPRGAGRRRGGDRSRRAGGAEEEELSGYEIASLTGLESMQGPGTLRWTPLRKHLGITAFGDQRLHGHRGRSGRRRGAHGGAARPRGDVRRPRPAGRRSSSTARRSRCPPARPCSYATRR